MNGEYSLITKIVCNYCDHSRLVEDQFQAQMDAAMSMGESLRARLRCTQCRRRDARIDYCSRGQYYSDTELDQIRESTDARREYDEDMVGFDVDAYEPMQPIGLGNFDDEDAVVRPYIAPNETEDWA